MERIKIVRNEALELHCKFSGGPGGEKGKGPDGVYKDKTQWRTVDGKDVEKYMYCPVPKATALKVQKEVVAGMAALIDLHNRIVAGEIEGFDLVQPSGKVIPHRFLESVAIEGKKGLFDTADTVTWLDVWSTFCAGLGTGLTGAGNTLLKREHEVKGPGGKRGRKATAPATEDLAEEML